MYLDGVRKQPRPVPDGGLALVGYGGGEGVDDANGPLGDRIEIVIVRRAQCVTEAEVDALVFAERCEPVGHEAALVVGLKMEDTWSLEGLALIVGRSAHGGVEMGDHTPESASSLALGLEWFYPNVTRVLVDEERCIHEPPHRTREGSLQVHVDLAGCRCRRRQITGVRRLLGLGDRAVGARAR